MNSYVKILIYFMLLSPIALAVHAESGASKKIQISVNCAKQIGKIKKLNGVNFGPKISSESAGIVFRKQFYDLNVHSVRLHDVSLQNPGLMIVDTDMIFPIAHADVSDPRNYIFKPTDDYIKICIKDGAEVIYRLGPSIDHSEAKYRTGMPEAKKWAEICCNIIAHYNEGWANGYKFGIKYWEIWNEPNCKNPDGSKTMWAGTLDEFNKFYIEVSKIIKARFPDIKIGGPAHTHCAEELGRKFISEAAKAKAPIDFYSWHCYGSDLKHMVSQVKKVRKWLDEFGYGNAEAHLNEWHYFPMTFSELRDPKSDKQQLYSKLTTVESGVFATATMTIWQDAPIDVANFYYFGPGTWSLVDMSGLEYDLYYPFKAFGKIIRRANRLEAKTSDEAAPVLAGIDEDGKVSILASLFKTGRGTLFVELKNFKGKMDSLKVLMCDGNKKLEPADGVKIHGSTLEIPINADSSCILIEN